jgi:hypothetical protein
MPMNRALVLGALALALAAAMLCGCGKGQPKQQPGGQAPEAVAPAQPKPAAASQVIPAESVRFHLVEPDQEKRSGLYAFWLPHGDKYSYPALFQNAADGKPSKDGGEVPRAGFPVTLIGKLPGFVFETDLFQPEAGSLKAGEIFIPVKHARDLSVGRRLVSRQAYVVASLPVLPAGKYKATIALRNYRHYGDKTKIEGPDLDAPAVVLTCEFEVLSADGAGAKPVPAEPAKP